ncbi:hypothetical protein QTO34_003668 [Cnephaeus nilssonii]|uniref:E3 ubiquitin protein ligase n=1 Tax=Cnephaeus nilssonii TaxID=3371016 RepID=A0AA40HRZ6_CNENI|nr:hypothetical protein QTO34_003668 [Eptesicus nilssonii]
MDVTGQAFEDMQEQNRRLLQLLREKDDANFKLMSERIKANQIHKLLREERDELGEQVLCLKSQVDAQLLTMQKLEEKEQALQDSLGSVEKELMLCNQALELNKRKAVEAAQLAEDLKVQLEHVQTRLRESQPCLAESRAAREKESFNLKRAQEDISRLRRKLEKQRKVEVYADADEILQEEIKEYKARLTCPCCNTRKKDAVLTKCFHVFCFECVQSRYEARQRKCPKCNVAFGAHDFHRRRSSNPVTEPVPTIFAMLLPEQTLGSGGSRWDLQGGTGAGLGVTKRAGRRSWERGSRVIPGKPSRLGLGVSQAARASPPSCGMALKPRRFGLGSQATSHAPSRAGWAGVSDNQGHVPNPRE